MAPVFTLIEDALLKTMMKLIGWEEGGDGLFNPGVQFCHLLNHNGLYQNLQSCFWQLLLFLGLLSPPGGSMSNMYAVNLARYRYCPDFKEIGIYASPRLVMLTSQEVWVYRNLSEKLDFGLVFQRYRPSRRERHLEELLSLLPLMTFHWQMDLNPDIYIG